MFATLRTPLGASLTKERPDLITYRTSASPAKTIRFACEETVTEKSRDPMLLVYDPLEMRWDSGGTLSPDEQDTVLDDIAAALSAAGIAHDFAAV